MSYEYYTTLWVDRNASAEEIKKAYRKAAMENHPDRHGGDKAKEAKFKEINEAYSTLSDPQKKAHYDRFGTADMGGGGFGAGGFTGDVDLGDIFSQFFGGGFQQSGDRRRAGLGGEDIELRVSIDFGEALSGVKKTISFSKRLVCAECDGSGAKKGTSPKECPVCHGAGQVRRRTQTIFGVIEQTAICDHCHGSGKVISEKCGVCHGECRTTEKITKEVEVPAGIDDGMTIKLRGEGSEWVGRPHGDLYIAFSVPESIDGLTREDHDLHYELPLDPVELVLGVKKKVKIPVLGERMIEVKPGTQHGEVIKFKWDGVKHISRDTKWDLFVHVSVRIPKTISAKERTAYESIAHEKKLDVADHKGIFGKLFE